MGTTEPEETGGSQGTGGSDVSDDFQPDRSAIASPVLQEEMRLINQAQEANIRAGRGGAMRAARSAATKWKGKVERREAERLMAEEERLAQTESASPTSWTDGAAAMPREQEAAAREDGGGAVVGAVRRGECVPTSNALFQPLADMPIGTNKALPAKADGASATADGPSAKAGVSHSAALRKAAIATLWTSSGVGDRLSAKANGTGLRVHLALRRHDAGVADRLRSGAAKFGRRYLCRP